jgi:nucleotide-binding universal stress UspA family protein
VPQNKRHLSIAGFFVQGERLKILVTHDGSINSKDALKYGTQKVRENGGGFVTLYIFQDISGTGGIQTVDSDSEGAVRYEDQKRGGLEGGDGVKINILMGKGDPKEEIRQYTTTEKVDMIITIPAYADFFKDAALPFAVIPGTILVPTDNREISGRVVEQITNEARSAFSKVLLIGIIPIHLYSPSEKNEIEEVKKETFQALEKVKATLTERGIQTKELIRMGYPDEEIVKAAEEHSVSMIIIPAVIDRPSELKKAASIILDDLGQVKVPILLVPA